MYSKINCSKSHPSAINPYQKRQHGLRPVNYEINNLIYILFPSECVTHEFPSRALRIFAPAANHKTLSHTHTHTPTQSHSQKHSIIRVSLLSIRGSDSRVKEIFSSTVHKNYTTPPHHQLCAKILFRRLV